MSNDCNRQNPCKGREEGCTADCDAGSRCDNCRAIHNAREAQRRQERRAKGKCVVCGAKAATRDGQPLTLCPTHVEYYAERQRSAG